jgi:hypothetical protein
LCHAAHTAPRPEEPAANSLLVRTLHGKTVWLFLEGVNMTVLKQILPIVALLLALPAQATEVQGFTVNKIEGVGDLEGQLHERLTEDYVVSFTDCLFYLEGYVATDSPDVACDSDFDCAAIAGTNACSSLGGITACVECARDSDCIGDAEGDVLCDLSTRTCAPEPFAGECAVDVDCDLGFCMLWNGAYTCLECQINEDCQEGEWCQYNDFGAGCVTDAGGIGCDACPETCFLDEDDGFRCGQCLTDFDCLDSPAGPNCDVSTHSCSAPAAVGECTIDADCVAGYCVLWGTTFKCVPCTIDSNCGATTPVCLADEVTTSCVGCVDDDDCSTQGDGLVCNSVTTKCETKSGGSVAAAPKILVRFSVDSSSYPSGEYAVKVGTACSESGDDMLDSQESDSCTTVASRRDFGGTYTNIEVTVPVADILGDDCVDGSEGITSIYFYASTDDGFTLINEVSRLEINYDYEAPLPPQNIVVEPGEGNLKVTWDDDSNNEEVEYRVYWAASTYDESNKDKALTKSGLTAKSYQIDDLDNGTAYFVSVTAVDAADNESELGSITEEMPVAVDDFWEYYHGAGGGEQGGFCFVATAAYGTQMEPAVMVLRAFRDRILLSSAWGRALVDWYYINGPLGANLIRHSEGLRLAARVLLLPAVAAAWVLVEAQPATRLGLLLLLMAGGMLLWYRRLQSQGRKS